jgi:hypothetical protein
MNTGNEHLSPAELARRMKARRTRKMMIYNLCLLGALLVFGGSYLGYIILIKHGSFSTGRAFVDTSTEIFTPPDATLDPSTGQPISGASSNSALSQYPTRKFAIICDLNPAIHPRINKFLPGALSSFGKKQNVDVMVLSNGDPFVSVTKGSIPMSVDAQTAAWTAVHAASDDAGSSFIPALKAAGDEQVEAVYLLTTADQIKQLGPDPQAMFKELTHGRKVQLNCVIFETETDARGDLEKWKKLGDDTRGAYLLQTVNGHS